MSDFVTEREEHQHIHCHVHVICDAANVAILQQHYTIDSFHSNNFT